MDELYSFQSFNSLISCPNGISSNFGDESFSNNISYGLNDHHHHQEQQQQHDHNLILTAQVYDSHNNDHHHLVSTGFEMSDIIKSQIANHPLYPNLLSAYVECRKVGAPKELASLLEEISQENHQISTTYTEIGSDPQLDHFMRSYCEVLLKYKEELLKPFDEATSFLSSIEHQLSNLCKETLSSSTTCSAASCLQYDADHGEYLGHEQTINGDELLLSGNQLEHNFGNNQYQVDGETKEMLMRKYGGYLSSLKKEFLKKRKKGKLPNDARSALFDWWNAHYRWPYPTEEDKNRLSKITGLDPKQINNWFINQRKRHWRPSEDMRFAIMEGVSGGNNNISSSSSYLDDNVI